jgi:hypothetical protein|tara:strand:- start:131 stop:445 length:315 start_codon:yes stop_codon:yes gene_type:complete
MSSARIYKPAKTAMQSGRGKTKSWILEFEPSAAKRPDQLMGWISSQDMKADQVRIKFSEKEQAIDFARRVGISFRVQEQAKKKVMPKSYADNFRPDRKTGNWTH